MNIIRDSIIFQYLYKKEHFVRMFVVKIRAQWKIYARHIWTFLSESLLFTICIHLNCIELNWTELTKHNPRHRFYVTGNSQTRCSRSACKFKLTLYIFFLFSPFNELCALIFFLSVDWTKRKKKSTFHVSLFGFSRFTPPLWNRLRLIAFNFGYTIMARYLQNRLSSILWAIYKHTHTMKTNRNPSIAFTI